LFQKTSFEETNYVNNKAKHRHPSFFGTTDFPERRFGQIDLRARLSASVRLTDAPLLTTLTQVFSGFPFMARLLPYNAVAANENRRPFLKIRNRMLPQT
jgi:hypothetical protein